MLYCAMPWCIDLCCDILDDVTFVLCCAAADDVLCCGVLLVTMRCTVLCHGVLICAVIYLPM